MPTSTTSPAPQFKFGDVDCSGTINSIDSLKISRYTSSLSYAQNEPCKDIGKKLPNGVRQGDVDCNDAINSIDALKLSRYVANLSYGQSEPCPDIGSLD
jgi:hypothetical protein